MRSVKYDPTEFKTDWETGVSTETMAKKYNLTVGSVRTFASKLGLRRPVVYLTEIRKTRGK